MTLVWPGKDRERGALGVGANDLQVVERLEPEPDDAAWRNLLVFGDNATAMESVAERFAGELDLIYIDPPFATGLSYFSQTGRGDASLAHRAYRDHLGDGMAGYADIMFERLTKMHTLLNEDGKLFVHCDWRANAVLRLILDELFGSACFRNEIIWRRAPNLGRQAASKQLGRVIDSILVYSKAEGSLFAGTAPKRRALVPLDRSGKPKGTRWDEEAERYFTTAPRGDYTDKSIAKLRTKGRIYDSPAGKVYIKYFLTLGDDGGWYKEQPVDTLWDDYEVRPLRHRPKSEVMGYDTQKPEGLLERIIRWSTKPGDLVADFFCGSGTTMAVAESLGRRWIGCDRQRPAIEISRRRLAAMGARFDVCSVVRAERRVWGAENEDAQVVLSGFGAEPKQGRWGEKDAMRIFAGPLDAPMSEASIEAVCVEAGGGRVVVLAWEWTAHDARALRKRMKKELDVDLVMRTVPLELMRGGVKQSKLRYLERAEIELEIVPDKGPRNLAVRIVGVRCPDVSRLREDKSNKGNKNDTTVLTWSDYVDSWRVDVGGASSEIFSTTWHAIRQDGALALQSPPFAFDAATRVKVKVFTVFGDEIDRTIRIE